ncbi:MAG: hypothetical protein JWM78_3790 [Verrucomicrobiaceae bacterium]|nr:hypothetical protein [Verrucomicrobiaceae bacterium]
MLRYLAGFIATALVLCALDGLWLGVIAADLYKRELGPLLLAKPLLPVAALFYFLFVIGIQLFAVMPARGVRWQAALRGGLFGFFTYMTYDLTNLATLHGWSGTIVGADILWGIVVTALAALAGSCATRRSGV